MEDHDLEDRFNLLFSNYNKYEFFTQNELKDLWRIIEKTNNDIEKELIHDFSNN